MAETAKQIKERYQGLHAALEARYYKNAEISKAEFDALHGQLWDNFEADMIAGGHIQPAPDFKDMYDKAANDTAKIEILAKAAGLK
ncbi:hypothetical protein ACFLYS_01765 [Chloroflexota bacterium]